MGGGFVAVIFLLLQSCFADKAEKNLVEDLLKNYSTHERPVYNPEDKIQLEFQVSLQVSEKLMYEMHFSNNMKLATDELRNNRIITRWIERGPK